MDQLVKLLVYYNMTPGLNGQINVLGDFFKLYYITNEGMAFGMELGGNYGKIFLTSFRLVAMGGIAYYMYYLLKNKAPMGLLICIAFILGGASGNIIDSVFYGVFLNNAPYDAISPWFHGQVIDMFYLDIWEGRLPGWLPFWGGSYISLWPIFNVADAAIFCSVGVILAMKKKYLDVLQGI